MKLYKFNDIETLNSSMKTFASKGVIVLYTQIKIVSMQEYFYVFTDENKSCKGTSFKKDNNF